MIEDNELGLKVAEDPEERFWIELKEKCAKIIIQNKHEMEIQEEVSKFCTKKLKSFN